MKILWFTDPHLDRFSKEDRLAFARNCKSYNPDAIVISGDIGIQPLLEEYLLAFQVVVNCTIYFVLGNHDFYNSSFVEVIQSCSKIDEKYNAYSLQNKLNYLSIQEPVLIGDKVCLTGQDGFYDLKAGVGYNPTIDAEILDNKKIQDLWDEATRKERITKFAEQQLIEADAKLQKAVKYYDKIYFVTHYPPFSETSLYRGRMAPNYSRGYFCWVSFGNLLRKYAQEYPNKYFRILCGHTHEYCREKILDNLEVIVGRSSADQLNLEISNIFEI